MRPSLFREGDKGGGKVSPGEKSFGKPSVADTEAKRNATPREQIRINGLSVSFPKYSH